jgi:glutaredoxin 3
MPWNNADRMNVALSMPDIVIYTRQFCGFCSMATRLLDRLGIAYEERDATGKPDVRAEMIQRTNGAFTFPQIFFGDRHVGGCRELYHLEAHGGLQRMMAAATGIGA